MTFDQWMALCAEVNEVFVQPIAPEKARVYFRHLQGYDVEQVTAGIYRLVHVERKRFLPAVAEVLDAIDGADGASGPAVLAAPDFSTVLGVLDGARFLPPAEAVDRMTERAGPVAAAWMCAVGLPTLKSIELAGDYGAVNLRDLERRWFDFVKVQRERKALGLPVAEATPQGRLLSGGHGQPRRVDFAAAVGQAQIGGGQ